jgi:2-amino-4-hydroxy-6-hydroxymethyldihydropteridine diphosphokinase
MVLAYVGLGANLGDPRQQLRAGLAALAELPRTHLVACSSLYRSAPVGVAAQPDFFNAVCAIETALPAIELMHCLLEIEARLGRVRGANKGEPRTLDLDLLLYGSTTIATPELTLPHPRLHQRAFVLLPLAEIAPGIEIPGRGPLPPLLRACAAQQVQRLENDKIAPQ